MSGAYKSRTDPDSTAADYAVRLKLFSTTTESGTSGWLGCSGTEFPAGLSASDLIW